MKIPSENEEIINFCFKKISTFFGKKNGDEAEVVQCRFNNRIFKENAQNSTKLPLCKNWEFTDNLIA